MTNKTLAEEAWENVAGVEIPDPESKTVIHGIKVHEVLGPFGEPLLVAFGLIPLAVWLDVVNAYYAESPADAGLDPKPWDPEDSDKVVRAMDRLHYHRVAVVEHPDSQESPFTIQWNTEGIIPITVWVIHFEAPEG